MSVDGRHVSPEGRAAVQRVCAWCGPLVVLICGAGMLTAGFVTPPSAALSADGVSAVFRESTTSIRIGMILLVIGGGLIGLFFAQISTQMRRIEGPRPTLTYAQLLLGACFVLEIILPAMVIQVAAFRPERTAELQQMLNDMCWLCFFGIASTGMVQWLILGIAILQDTRAKPIFPRWAGYFNIWAALMLTPGTVVVFFKTGPLSWTGLFIFWVPFSAFFVWLLVTSWLLLKAVDHELAEDAELAAAVDATGSDLAEQVARLTAQVNGISEQLVVAQGRSAPH